MAKKNSSQLPSGLQPAPAIVIVYTLCGIVGSLLALFVIAVLSGILYSHGLKARSLHIICPLAVYMQYLSAFLQLLSVFNHVGYLPQYFFVRLADHYPGPPGQPLYTAIIIAQMALGPILPILMLFTIYQTKQMCYVNLKKMVAAAVIQKHIFRAIGACQMLSSTLVMAVCLNNLFRVLGQLENSSRWSALLINYTYFAFPIFGVFGLILGFFYLYVTAVMSAYELETLLLEESREASILAGQRVLVQKGAECRLQHIVDKPSINGQDAVIDSSVADDHGKVTVILEGKEIKVEEYQMIPTCSEEELAQAKERATLKTAELLYLYEERGNSLKRKQMIYVTAAQVMCGFLVVFVILLYLQSRFSALAIYREIYDQIPPSYDYSNLTPENATAAISNELRIQSDLCSFWTQCFSGTERPLECGTCEISRPAYLTPEQLSGKTFDDGNLFDGDSLIAIISYGSAGGAAGLIFGIFFMRCVAKTRIITTICTSILIAVYFAVLGLAICPLPKALVTPGPLTEDQCGAPDFGQGQRVSPECLKITAAFKISQDFETESRLSVSGCIFNMLLFLVESLFNLARAIQIKGPTVWAKFEMNVFLYYFLLVIAVLTTGNAFFRFSPLLEEIDKQYESNYQFAANLSALYGPAFPLYEVDLWRFQRQDAMAGSVWYNFDFTIPTMSVISFVQLVGIFAGCFCREHVWVIAFRVVLIIDALYVLSYYSAITYLASLSVNLVHNLVIICIVPLCVQLVFALQYACQSDILPIFENLPVNPLLSCCVVIAYMLPVVGILMLVFGFCFFIVYMSNHGVDPSLSPPVSRAQAESIGYTLMSIGGAIVLLVILVAILVFARFLFAYYDDWTQMAADKLAEQFPKTFGKQESEENDEKDEVKKQKDAADLAESAQEAEQSE